MNFQMDNRTRVLCLHAAAKRLQMPERTLRYQASRGRIEGAFKEGKLWKFPVTALTSPIRQATAGPG
ncbi:MAG: hypothetical protein P4L56_27340 [Candidatus Sulfopaludibacter sp.]|nr:hypothetical protein [Candidatus Sulfopaludibacter sp.]